MVGTKPMRAPARRQAAIRARNASARVTVSMSERVLGGGKRAAAHRLGVGADRLEHGAAAGEKVLAEFRTLAGGDAEHVVEHQHLAVAIRAGADADGRNRELRTDAPGERRRHALE